MDWKLEVVIVPVADIDRARQFYAEQVGFVVDHDTRLGESVRIVQLTPPGSGCSIVIGMGMGADMPPGSPTSSSPWPTSGWTTPRPTRVATSPHRTPTWLTAPARATP